MNEMREQVSSSPLMCRGDEYDRTLHNTSVNLPTFLLVHYQYMVTIQFDGIFDCDGLNFQTIMKHLFGTEFNHTYNDIITIHTCIAALQVTSHY